MRVASSWLAVALAVVLLAGCLGGGKAGSGASGGTGTDGPGPSPVDVGTGTGAIDGVVVDAALRPIAKAVVRLQGAGANATTDGDGRFAFAGLAPGAYVLNASAARYTAVQATADVSDGAAATVRIVLVADGVLTPYVERYHQDMFLVGAFCAATYCNKVVSGNSEALNVHDRVYFQFSGNVTMVQAEVQWDSTTNILGDHALLECSAYGDDANGDTSGRNVAVSGQSPLLAQIPSPWTDEDSGLSVVPHQASCELSNANGEVPASMMVQQQAQIFVHVFYNFVPDPAWSFIADGDYPVPPA